MQSRLNYTINHSLGKQPVIITDTCFHVNIYLKVSEGEVTEATDRDFSSSYFDLS